MVSYERYGQSVTTYVVPNRSLRKCQYSALSKCIALRFLLIFLVAHRVVCLPYKSAPEALGYGQLTSKFRAVEFQPQAQLWT